MRRVLWIAFFVVVNVVGIQVFKAAVTLPFDEALLPRILAVPLIGLAALGAARVAEVWGNPDD